VSVEECGWRGVPPKRDHEARSVGSERRFTDGLGGYFDQITIVKLDYSMDGV
jgi:hypothetical protein